MFFGILPIIGFWLFLLWISLDAAYWLDFVDLFEDSRVSVMIIDEFDWIG